MSVGRIYKIRKACGSRACGSRVNYFTYVQYNDICKEITQVNRPSTEPRNVYVHVTSKDAAGKAKTIILDILKYHGLKPETAALFTQTAPWKLKLHFDQKNQAASAADYLSKMVGDQIVEDKILTSGAVTTVNGLGVAVNVTTTTDGNGGSKTTADKETFVQTGDGTGNISTVTTETGSSWTTWLLIGGGVIGLVIVIALFLKKK